MAGSNPILNLERIQTPLLVRSTPGKSCSLTPKPWGLSLGQEAFEMMVFPYGFISDPPAEREASLTATVDWMNFGCKAGEIPRSASQNQRWRKIKSDWDQVRTEEAKGRKSP